MFRGILTVVLIVLLVAGCWMIYKRVNSDSGLGSGNVYFSSSSKDQATTYFGDKAPEEVHPTPSRSDDPGTINTEPVPGYNGSNSTAKAPQAAPLNPQPLAPSADVYRPQQPITPQPYGPTGASGSQQYGQPNNLPRTNSQTLGDSFGSNPPNGLAYSGSGKYELYRQGDLTYRMDTNTGESCVLYATMEEWAKPIVYSHGCGSRGGRGARRR